jgi:hypothetical protein
VTGGTELVPEGYSVVESVTRHHSGMAMERFETRQNFVHLNLTIYERLEDRSALRASELVLDAIAGVSLPRGRAAALDLRGAGFCRRFGGDVVQVGLTDER